MLYLVIYESLYVSDCFPVSVSALKPSLTMICSHSHTSSQVSTCVWVAVLLPVKNASWFTPAAPGAHKRYSLPAPLSPYTLHSVMKQWLLATCVKTFQHLIIFSRVTTNTNVRFVPFHPSGLWEGAGSDVPVRFYSKLAAEGLRGAVHRVPHQQHFCPDEHAAEFYRFWVGPVWCRPDHASKDLSQPAAGWVLCTLRVGEENHYTCMREGTVKRGKLSHK